MPNGTLLEPAMIGWMWLWGMVGLIVFLLLAALIVWGGRRLPRSAEDDPALAILQERYAKGEIGPEEFQSKKRDLRS